MLKYYINSKSKPFAVEKQGYIALSTEKESTFYQNLLSIPINDATVNGDTVITIFGSDIEVIFSLSAFDNKYNVYNNYLEVFREKINKHREKINIKKLRKIKPLAFLKINRAQCKIIGSLTAGVVGSALLLSLYLPSDKEILEPAKNKAKNFKWKPKLETIADTLNSPSILDYVESSISSEYTSASNLSDTSNSVDNETLEEPSNAIRCIFPFEVKEDDKFETTVQNCAPYADEYISRYGLPRDLTYALICQESGELDTRTLTNGALGPMQIQVNEMDGEFFKVPIYENGKFTGNYDCFYAVETEADKSNPKYVGYKVLAMDNLKEHFQIGCAYIRRGIDRYKNVWIGFDAHNKGLYAFSNVFAKNYVNPPYSREYYQEHLDDFSWTNFIAEHYKMSKKDPDYVYGDPIYLANVLRYLPLTDGKATITYKYKDETIVVELVNELLLDNNYIESYNNGQQRG